MQMPQFKVFLKSGQILKFCTVDAIDMATAMLQAEETYNLQAVSAEETRQGDLEPSISALETEPS